MILDTHMQSFARVRALLSLPFAPIQYLIDFPTTFIEEAKTTFATRTTLIEQNTQLRIENLQLQKQLQRLLAIESENNYLKSLLRSAKDIKSKTLIAELLAVATEPFIDEVVIDKGSRDGLYLGQPVLDATGVMGQISQVGPITSRVLLINDPRSGVAVQDQRNGLRAIAVGDGYSGKLRLMYIPKTANIRIGDLFMTSGLSDHYPEGYPVGRVISVMNDPAKPFIDIRMEPSAELTSSRQVLLVWYHHA